jgi:prophage maintenance system killer protein
VTDGWPQLTYEDALRAHYEAMIGSGDNPAPVIAAEKLEGALMRPAMAIHYEDAPVAVQVARLVDGVATAHAFRDGNKRTAAQLGDMYLRLRGCRIASPSSDDTTFGRNVELLVSEDYPAYTIEEFTAWLETNIVDGYAEIMALLDNLLVYEDPETLLTDLQRYFDAQLGPGVVQIGSLDDEVDEDDKH